MTPTMLLGVAALAYALLNRDPWEASQAMLIRDEAVGSLARLGRFDTPESRKSAQEMVLEVARSRSVLREALLEVGAPPRRRSKAAWPTETEIADTRKTVAVKAPSGTEFGKTELFYLRVKDKDRDRAIQLASSICRHLDVQLREVRDQRSASMIDELTRTRNLAADDLQASTEKISAVEVEVGGDLGELRLLTETSAGDSNMRQTLVGIDAELRLARTKQRTEAHLLELITAARHNPQVVVDMPTEMLTALPALKQIKDNLVTAQLKRAELLASRTDRHPMVQNATEQQAEIEAQLHRELGAAASGILAGIEVGATRIRSQMEQRSKIEKRMQHLAAIRAKYSNLSSAVKNREELVKLAEQNLNNARANQAGAAAASLITLIDTPVTGDKPVGPRKAFVVLGGLGGGLMAGLGLLFLLVPIDLAGPAPTSTLIVNGRPLESDRRVPERKQRGGLRLRDALAKIQENQSGIWT
ncbi:GumC domain-containing protein [Lignipirellula cremea]|nr:hypothetical protein [Lignipirellula cremea]